MSEKKDSNEYQKVMLKKYLETHSVSDLHVNSFDRFVESGMQKVVEEIAEIQPDIIPPSLDSFKIKFGKIWIKKPKFKDSDGALRDITPMEVRMRSITYESPIYLEMIKVENGVEKEKENVYIGNLPIMLKSKYCYLNGKNRKELIETFEDPDDPGGYFLVNGTERVVVIVEDLAPNKLFVEKQSKNKAIEFIGKIFSEDGRFRIPHLIEKNKDGRVFVSFTRVKKIPFAVLMKALGVTRDKEIMDSVSTDEKFSSDVFINLFEAKEAKTEDDALEYIAKRLKLAYTKQKRIKRVREIIDRFLLPHIGHGKKERALKARFLGRAIRKILLISYGELEIDDKDHYANKRLRLSGDLMESLFRFVFRMLVGDVKYNFERLVKRGKYPMAQAVTRSQLLTSRMRSALATGEWVGNRHGISQHIERLNYYATISHLGRVVSLLSSSRENFEARDLHPTHWGKLCTSETPEGQNIGLRKNLAMTCGVSIHAEADDKNTVKALEKAGLKVE